MPLEPGLLQPLNRAEGRRTAVEVYDALRSSILSGRLKPGVVLSQVEVARALNVSRTPVREAMRMLQEGGLISSEPNFRSSVIGFDPEDIKILYTKRILLEGFGATLTARRMTRVRAREMLDVIVALEGEESHADFATWQTLHRRWHRLIVAEVGEPYAADLEQLEMRSERYQSAYKGEHLPGWWRRGETEHRAMYAAMAEGDAATAGELTARHLARTALELLAALAPEHDTSSLRASLQFAISAASSKTLA